VLTLFAVFPKKGPRRVITFQESPVVEGRNTEHYGHPAVEVGDIRRDIAYHGDTLNTASRIQGLCNEFGAEFPSSMDFLNRCGAS
jgi:class 3 adenylate cyclase